MGEKEVPFVELESAIKREVGEQKDAKILLRADGTAQINEMVKVMNIAIRNEYSLNLATDPE